MEEIKELIKKPKEISGEIFFLTKRKDNKVKESNPITIITNESIYFLRITSNRQEGNHGFRKCFLFSTEPDNQPFFRVCSDGTVHNNSGRNHFHCDFSGKCYKRESLSNMNLKEMLLIICEKFNIKFNRQDIEKICFPDSERENELYN